MSSAKSGKLTMGSPQDTRSEESSQIVEPGKVPQPDVDGFDSATSGWVETGASYGPTKADIYWVVNGTMGRIVDKTRQTLVEGCMSILGTVGSMTWGETPSGFDENANPSTGVLSLFFETQNDQAEWVEAVCQFTADHIVSFQDLTQRVGVLYSFMFSAVVPVLYSAWRIRYSLREVALAAIRQGVPADVQRSAITGTARHDVSMTIVEM